MFSSVRYPPQLTNVILANLLLFTTSVVLSMGVFTVPIETAAPALKSVWSSGLGLSNLLSAPAISLTGFVLDTRSLPVHNAEIHPVTSRLRRIAFPVSAVYFTLLFAIPAIDLSSATLLRFSTFMLSVPSGVAYILTIEALLAWMPKNPGLAMTFVSAGFGLSQFTLSPLMAISIAIFGVRGSLILTAIFAFVLTYVSVRFLSFPTGKDLIAIGGASSVSELGLELLPSSGIESILTWPKLLQMPEFYLYAIVTFTGRTAQSLFPYYFKLGDVFGLSTSYVVIGFQTLSILGIFYAFTGNTLLEVLSTPHKTAVKPLLTAVFLVQGALFLMLVPATHAENGPVALVIISMLIIMLESQTAFGVILARDTFGRKNSALVFGVAGGLSFGCGSTFFVSLMAAIEEAGTDAESTPATFIYFYPLAACSCVIGALCVMSMRKRFMVYG